MHSIKLIRTNSDFFIKKLRERNIKINLADLINLDKKNRELIQKREKLEQEKKLISKKKEKRTPGSFFLSFLILIFSPVQVFLFFVLVLYFFYLN